MKNIKNKKIVIITGGAKGIGAACARLFREESYQIVILDPDKESGEMMQAELGDACLFIPCDVSENDQVEKAVRTVTDHLGNIEVLVNNAGIQTYGTVTGTTEEIWDKTMNVNLKSHFLCARAVIPSMLKHGKGVIISISSIQAFTSQNGVAAYTTSKSAILGLTRSIAVDYGPDIRAVAICPGTVDTPMLRDALADASDPEEAWKECKEMHLVQRIARPDEIAALVVFVAGDKAGFINGQPIRIDGGQGIRAAGSGR